MTATEPPAPCVLIVDRLVGLADLAGAPPDDLTVVALRCRDDA